MTPQELKNSILQQAIQGKLVEQRPEEGNAEELYQQIQAEKQRLIKEKKIKKEKPLPEITEEEKPFEIPDSWKWVRLPEVTEILYGFPFNSEKFNENGVGMPLIRIRDINSGYSKTYTDENCDELYRIKYGDMLVGMDGNFQVNFWNSCDGWLNQRVCKITANNVFLIQRYLFYYLPIVLREINGSVSYSTVKHLSAKILNLLILPLPPLAEQQRIVSRIEELLPLIDRYETAWSRLEAFNKRFPEDMQKSILQQAIQGKLVEQRPEEGTGEDLYQQIQAEKQALIKAKKIKKDKPLTEITDDEKPFEIPESWKWARLGDLAVFENGDRSSKYPVASDYVEFGIPFFGAKDMENGKMSFDNVRYISQKKFDELGNGKLQNNDFICLLRGSVGKVALFTADERHETGFICAQMVIIRCVNDKISDYLYHYMKTPVYRKIIDDLTTGTAVRQLPAKALAQILVPLPPLAEQKRIVARIEQLLPLCERLK